MIDTWPFSSIKKLLNHPSPTKSNPPSPEGDGGLSNPSPKGNGCFKKRVESILA